MKNNAKWGSHLPFPSANANMPNIQPKTGDDVSAQQLADLMVGKNMLGVQPPPQPTNEQMFGHLVPSEAQLKKAEDGYYNGINNWLAEATKPISSRFASEEEELAYWKSVKVSGEAGSAD